MNKVKKINQIAIAIPFVFALISIPFVKEGAILVWTLSTMITGFLQLLIAFSMLVTTDKRKRYLIIYFFFVVLFFAMWKSNAINVNYLLLIFPLTLCIYLTLMINYYENAR